MTVQQRPFLPAPSSLQNIQTSRQQIIVPDSRGVMTEHHLNAAAVQQIQNIVEAEKRKYDTTRHDITPKAATPYGNIPTHSLGSVPSTSSLHSSATYVGSQYSYQSSTGNR